MCLPILLWEPFPDNLLAVLALTAATADVKVFLVSVLLEIVADALTSAFVLFLLLPLLLLLLETACEEPVAVVLLLELLAASEL